jgi:hypothetical protein
MYDEIKSYQKKVALGKAQLVASDDGLIVLFRKKYDPETGAELEMQAMSTTTKQALLDEIAEYQEKIDTINTFITQNSL